MSENKKNIGLIYYKNAIPEEELGAIEDELLNVGIKLGRYDKSGIIMGSVDLFSPQVYFSFLLEVIASGVVYDTLKWAIIKVWKSLEGQYLNKIEAGGKITQKECTFGLSIDAAEDIKAHCILPNTVPDNDKAECIDKLFEFLKSYNKKGFNYLKYETGGQKWLTIDLNKEMQKLCEQKQRDI